MFAYSGIGMAVTTARVLYTLDGSVPDVTSAAVAMVRSGTEWELPGEYLARWEASVPGQPLGTIVRYRIEGCHESGEVVYATDGQGFWFRYGQHDGVTLFAWRVAPEETVPRWFRRAVVYQIFVDRFRRGHGAPALSTGMQEKHGGDFIGIMEAIPYLQQLGITCLWLTPIGPAPSYHRYDSTDHNGIDPVLGDETTFSEMVSALHDSGIRLILDFVPSHFSSLHPAFLDAVKRQDSPWADWFVFYQWPQRYRCFLESVPKLPSINTNSAGARQHLVDSACGWMRRGVDGFRLDHVIGHGMDFWVQFQDALEAENPEVVTVAEATDTGDAFRRYRGRVNTALDFPLTTAIRMTFGTGEWDIATFVTFLGHHDQFMADGPGRVSFFDNHDMDRFLFICGGEVQRLKLAILFLMTWTETPVLYYGTEVGMAQRHPLSDRERGGDALAREEMIWAKEGQNGDLLAFVAQAIALRRGHVALCSERWKTVHLDATARTWACRRGPGLGSEGAVLLVLFNLGTQNASIPYVGASRVLLASGSVVMQSGGAVQLGPQSAAVLGS